MKTVIIYTDGGCDPNPGVGAWSAVLEYNGNKKELVGGEAETTNNRMELLAAIHALEALREPCLVLMHTDSQYVQKGITEWMPKWKRQNWRRGKKPTSSPVKNVDLWQRLDAALGPHQVQWLWVPGHAGIAANERCDQLCAAEIARIYNEKRR